MRPSTVMPRESRVLREEKKLLLEKAGKILGLFLRLDKKAFWRKNLYKNVAAYHFESGISRFFSFVKNIFPLIT